MRTLKQIITESTANWSPKFFDAIDAVGRKTVANTIEKYIGLTDKRGKYLYFRFDGSNDYTFTENPTGLKSAELVVSSDIIGVISAKCENIEEVAFATAMQLTNSSPFGIVWKLNSITTDAEEIFNEETGKEWKNNSVRLARLSFSVTWFESPICVPFADLACQKCR